MFVKPDNWKELSSEEKLSLRLDHFVSTDDIDFIRGIIHIRSGKGDIPRVAYLNEYAKEVLRIYLTKIKDIIFRFNNNNTDTIFGVQHKTIGDLISHELAPICKSLNLPKQTSHNYRHSLGTHLLRSGCDVRYVQEILGHKRLKNTEMYIRVDKEDLKKVLDKFHPRQMRQKRKEEKSK